MGVFGLQPTLPRLFFPVCLLRPTIALHDPRPLFGDPLPPCPFFIPDPLVRSTYSTVTSDLELLDCPSVLSRSPLSLNLSNDFCLATELSLDSQQLEVITNYR